MAVFWKDTPNCGVFSACSVKCNKKTRQTIFKHLQMNLNNVDSLRWIVSNRCVVHRLGLREMGLFGAWDTPNYYHLRARCVIGTFDPLSLTLERPAETCLWHMREQVRGSWTLCRRLLTPKGTIQGISIERCLLKAQRRNTANVPKTCLPWLMTKIFKDSLVLQLLAQLHADTLE